MRRVKLWLWLWSILRPSTALKSGICGTFVLGWRGGIRSMLYHYALRGPLVFPKDKCR